MNNQTNTYSQKRDTGNFFSSLAGESYKKSSSGDFLYVKDNHLGSVLVTVSDRKIAHSTNGTTVDYYTADVVSATDMYSFGSPMLGRTFNSTSYRYGYGNHEKIDEVSGSGNTVDMGDRWLDTRIGRTPKPDRHASKYPGISPYAYVANNPINNIDPDGRDIISLVDKQGARDAGHQAVLIGDEKSGFFYVSKDGFTGSSGMSKSKSHYSVVKFKDIAAFKNSVHNYVLEEGSNYSDKNPIFKLDKDGNKIQRYDEAYRIETDPKTDYPATIEAIKSAQSDYQLCTSDCSDVVTETLKKGKTPEGKDLKTGDDGIEFDIPVNKQENIKENNIGTDVDITPQK